jgi:hypothetical protein
MNKSAKTTKAAKSRKQPAAKQPAASAKTRPAAKAAAPKPGGDGMGPKKQYLKSRPSVKVTFRLPGEAAHGAVRVSLVGDFNAWSAEATPMKRLRDGSFTAVVELEQGREYRFRYLIEGGRWENDWHADRYEPNAFGCDDSVVSC